MNIKHVGDGNVVLIAGGGKIYTDIAARFCRSEKSLEDIIASPYDKDLVRKIINSNHGAATEFDFFLIGIEGYARVTEIQLARKRIMSLLIKSGRAEKFGKRSFDVVIPEGITNFSATTRVPATMLINPNTGNTIEKDLGITYVDMQYDAEDLLSWTEKWYDTGLFIGHPEEELRYMKQQATEFKAIIGMNAHALIDWWKIRLCNNAQTEIRDLATKIYLLAIGAAPDLFANAGPSCKALGYCPENSMQHKDCKGKIFTQAEALAILTNARKAS